MSSSLILRAFRSAASRRGYPSILARSQGTIAAAAPSRGKVRFVAEAKDLESDEAIWALYERWCEAFSQERSREEMARRFGLFKETALLVDETNRADLPYKLEINDSADGKVRELRAMKVPLSSPGVDRRWMRHSSRSAVYYGRPISHEPAEEEVHPSSTE